MLRLRPFKPCDAKCVVQWIKDEYTFRLWSADRYKSKLLRKVLVIVLWTRIGNVLK